MEECEFTMAGRMMVALVVIALIAGSAVMVSAQGVDIDPFEPVELRTTPAADEQGTTEVGNPAIGDYTILINGWIEAFAYVSAYDNHISFGVMDPDWGTFDLPKARYAFSQTGAGYASSGTNWTDKGGAEVGGQDPLYEVNESTLDFDLAGILIETNARLDMSLSMGGFMRRVNNDGTSFTGVDTRRLDAHAPYELANQYKMVLKGRFLTGAWDSGPAQDEDGTQYVSPTSGETTDYNTWTSWDGTTGAPGAIYNNADWLWPVDAGDDNDPWTGAAALAYVNTPTPNVGGGWGQLDSFDFIVERGQAQGTPGSLSGSMNDGPAEAAEIWWAERVLRRGLQDVAGNYRADRYIYLTYREADTQWIPTVNP